MTSPNRPLHQGARRLEAAVEERRADQRLERVGEDRRALGAAAARLALRQAQHVGQAERQRHAVQAVLAHQVGPHAGQVAFVRTGEALEQQARDGQAEHRVAEELEALVVIGAEAAMGQRAGQQPGLREAVAEPLLQLIEKRIHPGRAQLERECPRYLISRKTGVTSSISLS